MPKSCALVAAAFLLGATSLASAQGAGQPDQPKTPPIVTPNAPPISAQPLSELLYVPVPACRLAATASSTTGIFAADSVRTFRVRGTSSFPAQGGKNGGCGIPPYAVALAASVTVRSYSSEGALAVVDPVGAANTRVMAYRGAGYTTATPILPLSVYGTEPSVKLQIVGGTAVHLLFDAVGYFVPPIAGMINSSGGLYSGTSRLVSAVRNSTGSYTLTVDRDVTYCTVNAQSYSYGYEAHAYLFNNTTVSVYVFSRGAGTIVAQDDYVYVHVAC